MRISWARRRNDCKMLHAVLSCGEATAMRDATSAIQLTKRGSLRKRLQKALSQQVWLSGLVRPLNPGGALLETPRESSAPCDPPLAPAPERFPCLTLDPPCPPPCPTFAPKEEEFFGEYEGDGVC